MFPNTGAVSVGGRSGRVQVTGGKVSTKKKTGRQREVRTLEIGEASSAGE